MQTHVQAPAPATTEQARQHQPEYETDSAQLLRTPQFEDGRPEVTAQLHQQSLMTNSPRTTQLKGIQAMMANSPRVAQLQATQAVMAASPRVQKLKTTQAGTLAKQNQQASAAPITQRMEDEEPLQATAEEPEQREQTEASATDPTPHDTPPSEAPKPNNTGLPDNLKTGIENLSGMSMDHVKVHYNSDKPAQLQAYAYAQGSEIHVAPGQEQHLPHEAWHVVQQAQGRVRPTVQMKGGVDVNDDEGLEREADVMGGEAVQVVTEREYAIPPLSPLRDGVRSDAPPIASTGGASHPVQRVDDNTHLPLLDLSKYILPSSGRSGNIVLLGDSFVYKLFGNGKEYQREMSESVALMQCGVQVLFYKGLEKRVVQLPDMSQDRFAVMMMYRAHGDTFMLAKAGGIKSFCNVVDGLKGNAVQLSNLYRWFKSASDAGIKDAQFIYDSGTNTPHFMDVHLGGVKGGGDCYEVAAYIASIM